jgi:hypothetical protein
VGGRLLGASWAGQMVVAMMNSELTAAGMRCTHFEYDDDERERLPCCVGRGCAIGAI